jgi:hypothetical protein
MYGSSGGAAGAPTALSVIELAKKYAKDPGLAYRVARQLWSAEYVAMVASRLDGAASLKNAAPEVLLAGTVPLDVVRAKLYEVLIRLHAEGPKSLEAAGLGGAVISDPGLLAVIKALPRKDQTPEKLTALQRLSRERREARDKGAGAPGAGPGGASGQPGQEPKRAKGAMGKKAKTGKAQPEPGEASGGPPSSGAPMMGPDGAGATTGGQKAGQGPEYQWMDTSELLARALCEQFAAAAKAAGGKGGAVSENNRPLEIPGSANVAAEYHFDWPKSLAQPDGLSGVSPDPMTVHYIRMEQKTSPRKVFAYFRTRMIRPEEHPIPDGFWMESFRRVPGTDRQRSVDILVSKKEDPAKAKPAAAAPGGEPGMASGPPGPGGYPGAPGSDGPGGMRPGMYGAAPGGAQPGQRQSADRDEVGDLIVEILTVEVKSPAPLADRSSAEEEGKEEAAADKAKTPAKGKSKVTTVE